MSPMNITFRNSLYNSAPQNRARNVAAAATGRQVHFGAPPAQSSNKAFKYPFSKTESLLIATHFLGTFAGIAKLITGSLPLQDVTPRYFDGHSGWPENTTVLAAGGQDAVQQVSNKWGGSKQRYMDYFVEEMGESSTQSIPEAHAKLSQSGFGNFYWQNVYPTSSFDLPLEMKNERIQPAQCPDTFKKSDDPRTQHILLIASKDASTRKVGQMLREQFPLIPPDQITVLKNPTKEQLQASLSAIRHTVSQQSRDSRLTTPQFLLYYQGHGGTINKPDRHSSEGSAIGELYLADEHVDEKWLAAEIGKFPAASAKTLLFESCKSGSFIKV